MEKQCKLVIFLLLLFFLFLFIFFVIFQSDILSAQSNILSASTGAQERYLFLSVLEHVLLHDNTLFSLPYREHH